MRFNRHLGFNRRAILLVLLLLCFAGAALVNIDLIRRFTSNSTSAPVKPAVDLTGPALSRGNVIWLEADQQKTSFSYNGITTRELFRQALLIAARDEMGLQTRDASLREWRGSPPAENSLKMEFPGYEVKVSDAQTSPYIRWHQNYQGKLPDNLGSIAEMMEKLSRNEFVAALQKAGWSGAANVQKPDAPVPTDAEARLMDMEELSQFAVLRETHAAIRTDGESLPRLGALVRAYANLGQLSRYHWSEEFAVYTARSLIYAERMVAANPKSAFSLYHRAYACALAGLQGDALDALHAAAKLKTDDPPAWVALLEPYCNYQTGVLVDLSSSEKSLAPLGMYLAFLTVENSGCQGATMNVAQAALTVNPQCLRLIDAMCDQTGPGMLNELTQTGPSIFSKTLGEKWEKLPSFPQPLIDQIEKLRRPGGNPAGREEICQALIDDGQPDQDKVEPSWAALGRLVQETTFAHIQRRANLISEQWGVDASEYVGESKPFIGDHPFKFVIDSYGIRHSVTTEVLKRSLKESDSILAESTLRQMPLYYLESWILPDSSGNYWNCIIQNSDCTSFDMEKLLELISHDAGNASWIASELDNLRRDSPQSPLLIVGDIANHWDADKAVKWEADHGDYPSVAMSLGNKFAALHQWSDAERCLRKYIAVSADYKGYEALAKIYKDQKKDDLWLATLNEYIAKGQSYGLETATVQVEIANYYMHKRDFNSALPYADAAAQTESGWGILCAADAHTGVGDFDGAEQLYAEENSHYGDNPIRWYDWCTSTGRGDIATAKQKCIDYYTKNLNELNSNDLMYFGCLYLSQNDNRNALQIFKRRMKLNPGAVSALHIAIIDDQSHDYAARDAALDQVQDLPVHNKPTGRFAALLRNTCKSGPDAIPDPVAIDRILKDAQFVDQLPILAVTAQFLADRGHTAEAIDYLKRSIDVPMYTEERLWINMSLRQKGIDTWPLQMAARQRQYDAEVKSQKQ